MMAPVEIDPVTTGIAFSVIATVDTVDGDGNPVPVGTVVNTVLGVPDGKGGIVGWAAPEGYHVGQVTP